jgi:hypothetical protein
VRQIEVVAEAGLEERATTRRRRGAGRGGGLDEEEQEEQPGDRGLVTLSDESIDDSSMRTGWDRGARAWRLVRREAARGNHRLESHRRQRSTNMRAESS